ncbi:MAG: Gfo/Idh/MocA family oxidoreductase [Aliifodinibius sp.]|nr:Gfo/Idh/MocA family oxidoreductase [Fodinibius sp.]
MTKKRKIRCGIIGCGIMGREFAVASARWAALLDLNVQPEIIAICDLNENLFEWYLNNFDSIKTVTTKYQDLLSEKSIDFIYCAVPHNLHELFYIDIIHAGKHLLGEKPFGIDLEANKRILEAINMHPDVFVRCSSEFPFFPGAHEIHKFILENQWGRIIEVNSGFLHSSDINFEKPINWKRMIEINGEYGCMGDLGMHALHIPIRSRWLPKQVFASLSKIVTERPDGKGGMVPCKTWDNATIHCEAEHPTEKYIFPMTIKTYRIAPGEIDTWYIEVVGTKFSARYSTKSPKTLQTMHYKNGGKQEWRNEDLGYTSVYKTITGSIFEFGFTDAILQMWAAFIDELSEPGKDMPFRCITPQETYLQHQILTAALESGKTGKTICPNLKNEVGSN